uniref:Uncharacterized protein n=1 Tax=Oreochromis niloticus TaxID=8128 RepID=A0A669DCX7_ORENI
MSPNSPLFQYLQDLGHTDFEACPTASQEEEYGEQEGDLTSPGEDPQKTSKENTLHKTQEITYILNILQKLLTKIIFLVLFLDHFIYSLVCKVSENSEK